MRQRLLLVTLFVSVAMSSMAQTDSDCDGVEDAIDLCPFLWQEDQIDRNGDGVGDACQCGDQNGDGFVNVADIIAINAAIFDPPQVTSLCDANNDQRCNIGDILAVNSAIFGAEALCAERVPDSAPFCYPGLICDPDRLLISLGSAENNFEIDQILYAGAGTQQLDFELGFAWDLPGSLAAYRAWPAGVTVEIFDLAGALVESYSAADVSADPDAPVRTPLIPGHGARIVVSSGGSFVNLVAAMALLIRDVRPGLDGSSAPAGFSDALELEPGVETLAYLARPGDTAHAYYVDLPGPGLYSIYMSPFHMEPPWHDIGARVHWAVGPPDDVLPAQWDSLDQPRPGDTGIYKEILVVEPGPRRIFLAPDGDASAFYRITLQGLRELAGAPSDPLVVEMDGILDGDVAPTCATRIVTWAGGHRSQIDEFLQPETDYNRRVIEALVIGSASLLAATEGYSRFDHIDFYHSFDSLRDVDISFDGDCGRANALFHAPVGPIASINMFREATNDPFDGGITLLHEWGHYNFSIFDEYTDTTGVIDQNSAMGSQRRGIEFCGDLNHDDTHEDGTMLGPDSAWSNVEAVLGAGPPRPSTSPVHYPQNRGLYLDVLHELEALLTIQTFPNPSPTGMPVNGQCSSLGDPCGSDRDCASDSVCDAATSVCVPGAPGTGWCNHDSQCISNRCGSSDRCEQMGEIGEDCSDGLVCAEGRRCDVGIGSQNTGKCIPDDGEGQPGDFCSNDNHCLVGDTCLLDPGMNSGQCASPVGLGGECSSNVGCLSGACDIPARACVPLSGAGTTGQFCTSASQCASNGCSSNACLAFAQIGEICSNGRICAGGRRCDIGFLSQNSGRCIPDDGQGLPGQFCSHQNQCMPGDFCDLDPRTNAGVCSEPLPLGSDCSASSECASGVCDAAADVCVPPNGTGSTGTFCTQGAQCQSNACSGNTCLSLAPIGAICSNGRICAAGRRCDTGIGSQNTGRCIPDDGQGLPGQFCSHNNQCMPGDFCDLAPGQNSGVCAEPLPLGSSCDASAECQSGVCDAAADVCVSPNGTGGTGSFCTQGAQCQSNACSGNACLSFAQIGEICSNGRICAGGRRCDSGFGTQNTGRCIPNDGQGLPGQFCSHNNQCLPGHPCILEPGQNFGSCG